MHKPEKNKLIPALRFPEFRNGEEWRYEHGDILFDSISNKDHNSDLPILAITQEHGAIPRDEIDYNVTVTDKSVESYKVVEKGDFIISLRSFQGGIEYSEYKGICSPAYIILRKKTNAVDYFYKQYFKTKLFIADLNKNLEGIRDGKMVSYKQFSDLLLPHPNTAEQQKIADCLSSLDELIDAENQRLDALKEHKRGMMQQLFPTEGEKLPKLRFAGFEGEWEESVLDNLGKFTGGGTPSRNNDSYWQGNFPWISSSDVSEDSITQINISRFITEEALEESATKLVPENSILLVSRVGVGKLAVTRKSVCTSQDFTNFTPSKDNVTFLAYYLKSLSNTLLRFSQGMAIKGFTKEDVSKLILFLPTITEQKQIADCLSAIDEQIQAQAEKIEQLKEHKKGLMQQLFPLPNE